jgi:hypothetical protein
MSLAGRHRPQLAIFALALLFATCVAYMAALARALREDHKQT